MNEVRLIDANALKYKNLAEVNGRLTYVLTAEEIDNAPTVFTCNACKNMGNERECVDCHDYSNYVHYEERPQGEWIKWDFKTFGAMGDWEYKCSNCEKVYDGEYNFCPNCGAEMRRNVRYKE